MNELKNYLKQLHTALIPSQQGRNSRPVRVIIGGQFAT